MVEGKLRKLSQCSDAFITAINTVIAKLTTTSYTIQEATDLSANAAIAISQQTASTRGKLLVQAKQASAGIMLQPDPALTSRYTELYNLPTAGAECDVVDSQALAGTVSYTLELIDIGGAKDFTFASSGKLTLPGMLKNTAIADPSAAAGQLWLSSTNVDNLKYSSATTLYTVHSTKGAVATNTAAAPTATASATAVMMACGGAITPLNTGRVHITISGQLANDTINDGATVDLRYGTGTAPINGAAVTGTLVGIAQTQTSLVGAAKSGFCISGVVTGLTLGTAIWIDASLLRVTGGNASITGVTISAFEV